MAATPQVLWSNNSTGRVLSGGTDAPAQGTSETLTVDAATAAAFPAASNAASPPTVFFFADPLNPTDIYMCTNVSGTGNTTWAVTRGADGSTPVTHSAPYPIRGVTPAGVLNSIQALLTNGLQAYYKSVSVTPSATINTYGTAFTFTPPSPYRFFLPLHVFAQATTIGSETLTILGTGTLEDGTSGGGAATTTTGAGLMDPANMLAGLAGLSGNNAGQTVSGTKRLATYAVQVKSSIASSTAAVTAVLWAAVLP